MRNFTQALKAANEAGDRIQVAEALKGLGQIERDLGNFESALQHYKEASPSTEA